MKNANDNNTPRLSIIVTVYNIEKYVNECIDSILAQDYTDYELIIVDDGSTDSGGEICDGYSGGSVSVIHTENRGVSAARNEGLAAANGEYILFVDGDDVMIDGALKSIMNRVQSEKADITTFHLDAFDDATGDVIDLNYCYDEQLIKTGTKAQIVNELLRHDSTAWGTGLNIFRADFLRENALVFSDEACGVEDCCFFLQAIKTCDSVCYIPMSLIRYRMNRQGSIMNTPNLAKLRARAEVYGEWIRYADELIADGGCGADIRVRMGNSFFYNVIQMYNKSDDKKEFFDIVNENREILKYCTDTKKRMLYMLIRLFGAKTALTTAVRGKYKSD